MAASLLSPITVIANRSGEDMNLIFMPDHIELIKVKVNSVTNPRLGQYWPGMLPNQSESFLV